MPKYLCKSNCTVEGIKGLLKEGAVSRRKALAAAVEAMGGKLEALYFALGETDIYFVVEYPDNITLVAGSLIGNASGTSVSHYTVLLTPEDMDQSVATANKMMDAYRPQGPRRTFTVRLSWGARAAAVSVRGERHEQGNLDDC